MKKRSRGYPGVNLEMCVKNAILIRDQFGRMQVDKESITKALGYSRYSGAVGSKIASLGHFGLLMNSKGTYQLTDLSEKLINQKNNEEYKKALIEAIYQPGLYKEILDKYEDGKVLPNDLPSILLKEHGIFQNACEKAARIFLESTQFAKVINKKKEFTKYQEKRSKGDKNVMKTGSTVKSDEDHLGEKSLYSQNEPIFNQHQNFIFALTEGKFGKTVVPAKLNKRDIQIMKKQIEMLELQIE
ncbi:hypothetical protein [Bacillus glycinifermentans]|uniref:hypothetical protein n=1 Tax=Bacillus glycinifermentans TaxID=1664069 RepID=UPI0022E3E96C|nr:hypothetical protein [Bacillus glycinifermentans]